MNCCNVNLDKAEASLLLSNHGLNRTKTKVEILTTLSTSPHPMSVTQLHASLSKDCDISTVFRAIGQFKEKGLVRESNLGEGFFRYELVNLSKKDMHHHHHVRCRSCGQINPLQDCDLSFYDQILEKLGYQQIQHHLEFTGVCAECIP
jgi:Fur family transcriptional regulator, ferric uptake regulator